VAELGHGHNPAIRGARAVDPTDTTPLTFRGSWQTDAFVTLPRNAIAWGMSDWHDAARAARREAGSAGQPDGTEGASAYARFVSCIIPAEWRAASYDPGRASKNFRDEEEP
jgi:hypothetical protein